MSDTDQTTADLGAPPAGCPGIAQVRKVVTEIPGPRSRELLVRQRTLLPSGVESTLPVFIEAAGGGVVVDADGNSLIDFGSGIAVTTVGNSADAVVRRAAAQLGRFTHTCFLVNRSYPVCMSESWTHCCVLGASRTV
ncbi:aminotransferase class III-fold pyridoxal phosphate-dependent enzyme, partial [Streptomyces sp. NPDC002346]